VRRDDDTCVKTAESCNQLIASHSSNPGRKLDVAVSLLIEDLRRVPYYEQR